jgi:FkbM family methyltransferase
MTREELIVALEELLSESMESVIERERTTFDKLAAPYGEQMLLFGTGGLGRKTLKGLRQQGIKPLAFCDNNPSLWGTEVEGVLVLSPENAVTQYADRATFVVTIWSDKHGHPLDEVKSQLNALGAVTVVSFLPLYWKYPKQFLPYFSAGLPESVILEKSRIIEFGGMLSDSYSRKCYLNHIIFRLKGDLRVLFNQIEGPQYFVTDLINKNKSEAFIDCGAYDGDTLKDFLKFSNNIFSHYYALEPDSKNNLRLNNLIKKLDAEVCSKIKVFSCGASNFKGSLKFNNSGAIDSSVTEIGDVEISCMPMDELLIDSAPTFLKIDIEGEEFAAIEGASDIIAKNHPVIAIAAYHKPDDLWLLGLELSILFNAYSFFIRPHAMTGWENILYAVPPSRLALITKE